MVTGIGGFVGSALARTLVDRGSAVVGLIRDSRGIRLMEMLGIRDRVKVVYGSVNDPELLARVLNEYDVDTVFHLAAQTQVGIANRDPISTFESNIIGTWTVLEAVRRLARETSMVIASSDKAYGSAPSLPYDEETPLLGLFPYDASKACADILARSYAASFEISVAVVRCANIYGPGDLNWARLVPSAIRSALRGENPIVRSDGSPERDYLYITDAIDGYLRVASSLPSFAGHAFNLGTGKPISAIAVVNQILAIVGRASLQPVVIGAASHEIDRQFLNARKAHRLLGWAPAITLTDGLMASVEWYRGTGVAPAEVLMAEVSS
jgi:CDP-glucose 4,6-dehydratase